MCQKTRLKGGFFGCQKSSEMKSPQPERGARAIAQARTFQVAGVVSLPPVESPLEGFEFFVGMSEPLAIPPFCQAMLAAVELS